MSKSRSYISDPVARKYYETRYRERDERDERLENLDSQEKCKSYFELMAYMKDSQCAVVGGGKIRGSLSGSSSGFSLFGSGGSHGNIGGNINGDGVEIYNREKCRAVIDEMHEAIGKCMKLNKR